MQVNKTLLSQNRREVGGEEGGGVIRTNIVFRYFLALLLLPVK